MTVMLGGFAAACATVLIFYHYPLPWDSDEPLELPAIYTMGVWLSLLLALGFIGVHAWQLTEEARQLAEALAATELVFAREEHLSQLDGLAAAAAHELGTPLSTITVIATELERAIEPRSPLADDVRLLREQAQRCRTILAKLTELPSAGEPFDRMALSGLIEEVIAPHRNFGVSIKVEMSPNGAAEPVGGRNPALLYGLGNLVENAVDFAANKVEVDARWSGDEVRIVIADDGAGFPSYVLEQLGEPFVTTRPGQNWRQEERDEHIGMGLGFFIAKTLLERSGARLELANKAQPLGGAVVTVIWPRAKFEQVPEMVEFGPGPAP
jgi:two-component system sensor histidine kinase RegB